MTFSDDEMEQNRNFQYSWRSSSPLWISHVDHKLLSREAKTIRAIPLHTPSVHSFRVFLCFTRGIRIFLHHATWILPLLD